MLNSRRKHTIFTSQIVLSHGAQLKKVNYDIIFNINSTEEVKSSAVRIRKVCRRRISLSEMWYCVGLIGIVLEECVASIFRVEQIRVLGTIRPT
jgi:hypothetical protein